ncbi:flagellar hook assembly protein FlgD [Polycladidibacter hongkongensis]|uniref:flagellar hook assembly protein FlgD n=1 Tax=Polycladidibacter hongkongensis TaxID=1647556 RepID=UPI0008342108|nr:flagellar hook capping FlgD N-terminal domain-containing protein [Pseudovibrio hongkongensis]
MATISDVAGTGASATTTAATTTKINNSFDLFIKMLTTQAQNQDPLKPMDATQFTNQLVQFTMVEQQIASNKNLGSLLEQVKTQNASQFVNYIGKEVTAAGDKTKLANGEASWSYDSPVSGAGKIEISNSAGQVVATRDINLEKGRKTFVWDGLQTSGALAPEGDYSIKISHERADGQSVSVPTEVSGLVEMVDFSTGSVTLKVNGVDVPIGNLISVKTT